MCGRLLRRRRRLLALVVGLQLFAILLLYSRLVTLPASSSAPADPDPDAVAAVVPPHTHGDGLDAVSAPAAAPGASLASSYDCVACVGAASASEAHYS